jgi:hypothetical protein
VITPVSSHNKEINNQNSHNKERKTKALTTRREKPKLSTRREKPKLSQGEKDRI